MVKNPPANAGDARDMGLIPELGMPAWRKKWQPTPVFLPGRMRLQSVRHDQVCMDTQRNIG